MYKVFDLIFCFVLTHFKRTVNINFDKQKYIDKMLFIKGKIVHKEDKNLNNRTNINNN